jgi:hypothetical protein
VLSRSCSLGRRQRQTIALLRRLRSPLAHCDSSPRSCLPMALSPPLTLSLTQLDSGHLVGHPRRPGSHPPMDDVLIRPQVPPTHLMNDESKLRFDPCFFPNLQLGGALSTSPITNLGSSAIYVCLRCRVRNRSVFISARRRTAGRKDWIGHCSIWVSYFAWKMVEDGLRAAEKRAQAG